MQGSNFSFVRETILLSMPDGCWLLLWFNVIWTMLVHSGTLAFKTAKTKRKLQSTQNRLIRFVLKLPFRESIVPDHFTRVGWLPVGVQVNQIKILHTHKIFNNVAPSYLSDDFVLASVKHDHSTRSSMYNYFLPRVNSHGLNSFFYSGSKLWNNLPNKLKSIRDPKLFKPKLKKHLLTDYLYESANVYHFY